MKIPRRLATLYYYPANLLTWAVFAVVGLALNLFCAPLLLLGTRPLLSPMVRDLIRKLFAAWCGWLGFTRLVRVRFHGFTAQAMAGPAVYVSNHPGLMDATFLLSRLPDTICIFKPAVMRNPVLGPAALMAGYASGGSGLDLLRDVTDRIKTGRSLLIFPEGTRTAPGVQLNPLRPGFALIAARARVPVRVVLIHAPRDLLPKGWPWWRPPSFPAQVDLTLGPELTFAPGSNARELAERVALALSSGLGSTFSSGPPAGPLVHLQE
jgi:1-acyl-sn-glycerol-3-phosphate acyltransferase